MQILSLPVAEAEGLILCHNVVAPGGRRALRKGRALSIADLALLSALGRREVYVARLEADDVAENVAAERIALAIAGASVRLSAATTGRVNLHATGLGLLRLDLSRLHRLHGFQGVTLATLRQHGVVRERQIVATLKILPYALPEPIVQQVEAGAAEQPVLWVDGLPRRSVALVLSGGEAAGERLVASFRQALEPRLNALGAELDAVEFVALDEESGEQALAATLSRLLTAGCDLLLVAGDTAIMDAHDLVPRGIVRAGAEIEAFGVPVDPGNLLLLAYHGETPILGAPGCARSPRDNVIDLILPRLLAGDRLRRADLMRWAHGGLMKDVPERPSPRALAG